MTTLTATRVERHAEPTQAGTPHSARSERRAGWLLGTPFMIIYVVFLLGPVLVGLVFSFFNTTTVKSGLGNFVGLSNYTEVVKDRLFWQSMWHSIEFTIFTVPPLVILSLAAAVMTSRLKRGKTFYRIAYFAPYVVPSSVVTLIFVWMYLPGVGLLSKVFAWFGFTSPNFLGTTSGVWIAVTVMTVWWTFGFNFILYTAAIQDIPEEVYEAAAIDGASPWQQIRTITIPMLGQTTSLILILQVLASLKVFDQIYQLAGGGPNYTTRPVIEYIYDTGFTTYRGGYGAAATMIYFLIIVAVSALWYGLTAWRRRTTA